MSKPQVLHLNVAKKMFKYLEGMIDHGIFFRKNESKKIESFTYDINWACDQESRQSTFRYMFQLGQSHHME